MVSWRLKAPRSCGPCSPARWRKRGPPPSTCRKPIPMNSFMDAKTLLFVGLGVMLVIYSATVFRGGLVMPTALQSAIVFVTAFFDTLGIGSFATTTAVYKLRELVPVKLIPGTLNVGHALSTIAQAFIYTKLVPVDATALMLMTQLNLAPGAGDAIGLTGTRLWIGLAGNFVLGVLMMLGIGLYAPCMILVSLLGMAPTAAFPIMMGSCAFLMPISSVRFVRTRTYDVRATLGLALGGLPGVLVAAYVFQSMSLDAVRWLVVLVVIYTSLNMLMTAKAEPGDVVVRNA